MNNIQTKIIKSRFMILGTYNYVSEKKLKKILLVYYQTIAKNYAFKQNQRLNL